MNKTGFLGHQAVKDPFLSVNKISSDHDLCNQLFMNRICEYMAGDGPSCHLTFVFNYIFSGFANCNVFFSPRVLCLNLHKLYITWQCKG